MLNSARVVETMWRPDGITVGMRAVLQLLETGGPQPVPALAQRLELPRQGVQRHVDDLTELGLAHTRPNPRHRRSVLITLTGAGKDMSTRIRSTEQAHLGADTVKECTDDDLRTALRVLTALNRDVRERAQTLRADSREPHRTDSRTDSRTATEAARP
ncbi:MarR family winged helix-turn-helix transcriptional regulator [Kineosporia succinea]|uniref:MarR family winged helix-turn-helix transcriptional regulator n=1 Tax=Kineosporia succinea TaxID=84632 RepID=UPI0027D81C40|nr:MarR family winged helix-turn-helix transcriptional regulator [Kineosporia succinea]